VCKTTTHKKIETLAVVITTAIIAISMGFLVQMMTISEQKAYAQKYSGCNPENCDPAPGCRWVYPEFGRPYIDCHSGEIQVR
jgi:hypothetical protein